MKTQAVYFTLSAVHMYSTTLHWTFCAGTLSFDHNKVVQMWTCVLKRLRTYCRVLKLNHPTMLAWRPSGVIVTNNVSKEIPFVSYVIEIYVFLPHPCVLSPSCRSTVVKDIINLHSCERNSLFWQTIWFLQMLNEKWAMDDSTP